MSLGEGERERKEGRGGEEKEEVDWEREREGRRLGEEKRCKEKKEVNGGKNHVMWGLCISVSITQICL